MNIDKNLRLVLYLSNFILTFKIKLFMKDLSCYAIGFSQAQK